MRPRLPAVALAVLFAPACGSSSGTTPAAPVDAAAPAPGDAGAPASHPPDAAEVDAATPQADAAPQADDAGVRALSLPQAVRGALWVNPVTYASVPLHVAVDGRATAVTVTLDGTAVSAADAHDGTWTATLPVAGLAAGTHALVASAGGVEAHATLGVGASGMQMTDVTRVGNAGTPRLLALADGPYLAWTDRSGAHADVYLQPFDGAGNWTGNKTSLVHSGKDAFYARTAVGGGSIGVLYQEGTSSNPYLNYLEIVDAAGTSKVAPIALDPAGTYGSYGGDIAFDGTAFVATWRSNDGAGKDALYWIRVAPDGTRTGPVTVTTSPGANEEGGFDPITEVHIATVGGKSLLSYVQYHQSALAGSAIPKSRLTVVNADGSIAATSFCGAADDTLWHDESRAFVLGGAAVPVWGAKDVNDPDPNPKTVFFGAKLDAKMAPGAAQTIVDHLDDRTEPFLLAHPTENAVAAWLDNRSYHASQTNGRIQLYFAPIDATLAEGAELTFDHARFIAGTSNLNAIAAGTNVLLVWLDERHGGGITNPKPEVWMETIWY